MTTSFLKDNRFALLLVVLIAVLVITPLVGSLRTAQLIGVVLVTALLLAAINATGGGRLLVRAAIVLVMVSLVFRWAYLVHPHPALLAAARGATTIFLGLTAVSILRYVLNRDPIVLNKIFAAICVYLLFGLTMASVYGLIEQFQPGAFAVGGQPLTTLVDGTTVQVELSVLAYFSLVTLTTLGYGDVTPVHELPRILAALEALVGQVYIAVLIAWLVGQHIATRPTNSGN